jgi:hypothetical protein
MIRGVYKMKMLMNVRFPHEPFNTLVREGTVGEINYTFLAPTWEVGTIGFGDRKNIQTDIKDKVDQFINAYLSVNPKT